jgi:uncharacterized membrane protein
MTREQIENCWKDRHNWKWRVYYCKADPRVIVPRRLKWMGWTVNFARPSAIPITLLLIALLVVPLLLVTAKGAGRGIVFITGAASIIVLCLVCACLSSRTE